MFLWIGSALWRMLRWPGPEIEKVQCTPGKVESVLSTLVCSQVKLFHVVDLKNKKAVIYDQYTFKHA